MTLSSKWVDTGWIPIEGFCVVKPPVAPGCERRFQERGLRDTVSPLLSDHEILEVILKQLPYSFRRTFDLPSAISVLQHERFSVVICEQDLFPASWKGILPHVRLAPDPPRLLVTSRIAEEPFWLEALDFGAYDILVKPFDSREGTRIVELAISDWQKQNCKDAPRRWAGSGAA